MSVNKKKLLDEFREIEKSKIVSIFWVTSSQARAARIELLEKSGAITRCRESSMDAYPYMVFKTNEDLIQK